MASPSDVDSARRRRREVNLVKLRLRELRLELGTVNHLVGTRIDLKDSDLDALDTVTRHGPLTPTALARRMGVHVATLTGILNRLEAGGWITRERATDDRRAVVVSGVAARQAEVIHLYDGMNTALDDVLAHYSGAELAVIEDFLRRSTEAGRTAADGLARER
ncbi:MAG: MarR family transcriptional regulator [Actinomycetota bacterium]|nr:MarR family transcriptional regulator [Actinomycetota bacterium]